MWAFKWDGRVIRRDSLTLDQIGEIEDLCGESWLTLTPFGTSRHAKHHLTVMACAATGQPRDVIAAQVGKLTEKELLEAYIADIGDDLPTMYADGNPPSADETSTS